MYLEITAFLFLKLLLNLLNYMWHWSNLLQKVWSTGQQHWHHWECTIDARSQIPPSLTVPGHVLSQGCQVIFFTLISERYLCSRLYGIMVNFSKSIRIINVLRYLQDCAIFLIITQWHKCQAILERVKKYHRKGPLEAVQIIWSRNMLLCFQRPTQLLWSTN